MKRPIVTVIALLVLASLAAAQAEPVEKFSQEDKFRQLEELWPTPNDQRTASGAPGVDYWQQQVDYVIEVELDDENQSLSGSEKVTYQNNSPDTLRYLWVQLDVNLFAPDSAGALAQTAPSFEKMSPGQLQSLIERELFDGSCQVGAVTDANGGVLPYTIVGTMMRIDLPKPLAPGATFVFGVEWGYQINDSKYVRARTGFERFEEDGNIIYEMAHWFPRLAAYTDVNGWQHKQFLGRGEFTLEFGDFRVSITAPDDHIVAATGELQNAGEVLTAAQRQRLDQARQADSPMFIVTPEEAKQSETSKPTGKKTWVFDAENVRDFAWASSRKFIWDAQGHPMGGRQVLAMSYYPNEGEPLWSRYSTHAIIHTLNVYSRLTFEYPYPVAISVNGPVGGMEYPMICFNGPRPEKDGTYSQRTKYGLISVIIHEVGHNYFPMIVNSDERQWTWMDEGLNTFCQYIAEQEWEEEYPSGRGEPQKIVGYMTSANQVPIMTNSESILQFGANAYAKPATALNVLRETILGRELFDFAFREYSQRWMFKRPQPSDLFRTLEDASAIDLDWFWRGWFYSTDHVDIGIAGVQLYTVDSLDPDVEKPRLQALRDQEPTTVGAERYAAMPKRADDHPDLLDFYNRYDPLDVTERDRGKFEKAIASFEADEREVLSTDLQFYVVDFENHGGLVMPILLQIEFEDGSQRLMRIPAEIWRQDNEKVSKLILSRKPIKGFTLDPRLETADANLENNLWPPKVTESRFKLFKREKQKNPMQLLEQKGEVDSASGGGQ